MAVSVHCEKQNDRKRIPGIDTKYLTMTGFTSLCRKPRKGSQRQTPAQAGFLQANNNSKSNFIKLSRENSGDNFIKHLMETQAQLRNTGAKIPDFCALVYFFFCFCALFGCMLIEFRLCVGIKSSVNAKQISQFLGGFASGIYDSWDNKMLWV